MLTNLKNLLNNQIIKNEKGQDLAEYAIMLGLIALIVVGSITIIGGEIRDIFFAIADAFQN